MIISHFLRTALRGRAAAACAVLLGMGAAVAQTTPTDPYSYSRKSSFTYNAQGLLETETVEPGNPVLGVKTTHGYDAYGNRISSKIANEAGATGLAVFTARAASSAFNATAASGTIAASPAGLFATVSSNALNQSDTKVFDPRFGAVVSVEGPNKLTTRWELDDFGRKVKETRADGTSTQVSYCYVAGRAADHASNSSTCPTNVPAAEIPAQALSFTHTQGFAKDGSTALGPFTRVYADRAGREIRVATQGFDGADQPAGYSGATVVKDTQYNRWGVKELETAPYYLGKNTSTLNTLSNGLVQAKPAAATPDYGVSLTEVDDLGRPVAIYMADPQGSQASVSFGPVHGTRKASVQRAAHSALKVTQTTDKGHTRVEERNPEGAVIRVTDATGAQLAHQHDAFGNLVATKDALQNVIRTKYDIRGRRVELTDPDTGFWKYTHNALGELVKQESPNQVIAGQSTTMSYDLLGRMLTRVEPEYTSTWVYDSCTKGVGKLCSTSTTHGVSRTMAYDSLGRPSSSRTKVSGAVAGGTAQDVATAVGYDDVKTGRVAWQRFPTGLQVKPSYTTLGFTDKLVLDTALTINPLPDKNGTVAPQRTLAAGQVLWTALQVDALGKVEKQKLHNDISTLIAPEASTGRVLAQQGFIGTATTPTIQNQQYTWDSIGNLVARADAIGDGTSGAVSESFIYQDGLNRLTSYTVAAANIPGTARKVDLQYNALGMLLFKSDVGVYTYGPQGDGQTRPHALKSVTVNGVVRDMGYDANGNLITASSGPYRNLAYTSFNLPDSSTGIAGPNGTPKYTWHYDENHARLKETQASPAGTRTTWYFHPDNQGGLGFEREIAANGLISNRHYLAAGGATIGVFISRGALPVLTDAAPVPTQLPSITGVKLEYWHRDHLGSLVATSDAAGTVTARYAYDPFGKRRMTDGRYDAFGTLIVDWVADRNYGTDRGFTGHEHLDDIGLIHMNGRIFDPTLGIFLQGDPFIQDPTDLQNYNRYGYCLNNPMTCTDPTGFSWIKSALGFSGLNNAFLSTFKAGDIFSYSITTRIARTKIGYQIGSIAISVVSAIYCGGACNVVGQMAWAALAGHSTESILKTGAFAFISSAVNYGIGSAFDVNAGAGMMAANTVAHGVWGCAESTMRGGRCGDGFRGGLMGAALSNYGKYVGLGDSAGKDFSTVALNTVKHAVAGGIASVAGGGKFADGAYSASAAYLFNHLMHENTPAANGLHRRTIVRDDQGNALFGFSFGMNGDGDPFTDNFSKGSSNGIPAPGKAGNGEVYIDMNDPTTDTVQVFKTTPAEDRLIVDYMKSRIGDTAPYNALTNSCRDFSAAEFEKIKTEILRARAENQSPKFD